MISLPMYNRLSLSKELELALKHKSLIFDDETLIVQTLGHIRSYSYSPLL